MAGAKTMTKTGKVRDSQMSRLYDAEDTAATRYSGFHFRQAIPNDRLQGWVNEVMHRPAIQSRWGRRRIEVSLTHGGGRGGYGRIRLGVGARNEWVILHEIAHNLVPHHHAWHGPEFAGVLLFLVRTVLGKDAGDALRTAYREHRVRYTMSDVPKAGRHTVVTKTQRAKRDRETQAARQATALRYHRQDAVAAIRAAVAAGEFGPAGCKPRVHALATARLLEKGGA